MYVNTTFESDMPEIWGNWSVDSDIGKLRSVLMRRPGIEIENIADPETVSWKSVMDPEKARAEFDAIIEIFKSNGVTVFLIDEMGEDCPNGIYCRDQVLGSPEGVILARPGIKVRIPEIKYTARKLGQIGAPIIRTIHGNGIFDGACANWIDRETIIVGTGLRCNSSGFQQISDTLTAMDVKNIIRVDISRNQNHLDGFLGIADYDVAVTFPYITPSIIYDELLKRGFRIVEIPLFEEKINLACNFVALEPGKIVMPKGNPRTRDLLIKAGIEIIEVDMEELKKGGGAIHCMTANLCRDSIPVYSTKS